MGKKKSFTPPQLEGPLTKKIKVPQQLTPNQRHPSEGGMLIRRGDIVVFCLPPGLKLADWHMGVVVRTPSDPGGRTDIFDVVPVVGPNTNNPSQLCVIFDLSLHVESQEYTPPVPLAVKREQIKMLIVPEDSLDATAFVTECNRVRFQRLVNVLDNK